MHSLLVTVVLLSAGAAGPHLASNPAYRELVEVGIRVAPDRHVALPQPTMADGLSASAGRAAIEGIPSRHVPVGELLRKSVVAPLVYRFREIDSADPRMPVQGVDVWFVAYGELHALTDKEFLDDLFEANRRGAKVRDLGPAELESRGIRPVVENDGQERFVHGVFSLLDRVEVGATSRTFISRSDDSLVVAVELDRRFASDEEFPNYWRPITRDAQGKFRSGAARPYEGAASYLKATRLSEPRGALFVEYHLVFTEPKDWFRGANLLRSKLPILIQSEVRTFRRRLAKATRVEKGDRSNLPERPERCFAQIGPGPFFSR